MAVYCSHTAKTGGLSHLSYVEKKPEPLETEFSNVACSKTAGLDNTFLNQTSAVSSQYISLTLQYKQNTCQESKGFMGDSWITSAPTAESIDRKGGRFKGVVKIGHGFYPKDGFEDLMAPFLGGAHLVTESILNNGSKLYATGYKYMPKKVICFIVAEGTCSIKPGKPHKARWSGRHGNVHSHSIDHPFLVSTYFEYCGIIDSHNEQRQFELAHQKHRITHDPYCCLSTSLFGVCVMNALRGFTPQQE
eukprot:1103130-Ditylum_brightwellii.AAC.1